MKLASIVCGILLLAGIAQLPIGYYTFLRIAVTLCAIAIIVTEVKRRTTLWFILFGAIAILFNPVIPVYFYQKSIWIPIDAAAAVVFIVYGLKYKKHQNV
jgi:membrane-bound ClpP family serine protease